MLLILVVPSICRFITQCMEESDIIWKFTAEAIGISTDGGKTWPYGFSVNVAAILHSFAVCHYCTITCFYCRVRETIYGQWTGLYITTQEQTDHSLVYYAHNKQVMEESDIIWKFTADYLPRTSSTLPRHLCLLWIWNLHSL